MPNGNERNFVRLCAAIDGFRLRYGTWPTRVRIIPLAVENLRKHVLGKSRFGKVEAKIRLIPEDGAEFIAEDESGHSYDYGHEGFPDELPPISASDWLGVKPLPSAYGDEFPI